MRPPIETIHLFPVLNRFLIDFLRNLAADDWHKPTVARQWQVKDVVAHLLDGNYRQIAVKRDGWMISPDVAIQSNEDLVAYLNRLNAEWVKAARRLSPASLIEQLEITNEQVYKVFANLDPFVSSVYPVSWAGETLSYNWFDIAREYTERWLHQQQIREALGNRGIMTRELYHPFLHIFMQAWPFTCKDIQATEGTVLKTTITGEGGGEWFLLKEKQGWVLSEVEENNIAAETIIDGDIAWILFSKSIRKEDIEGRVAIKGNQQYGGKILDMVSVMA